MAVTKAFLDAALLAKGVWFGIDKTNFSKTRRMGIYDEFAGKLASAAQTPSLSRFLSKISYSMGTSVPNDVRDGDMEIQVTGLLDLPADHEQAVLACLRDQAPAIVVSVRTSIQSKEPLTEMFALNRKEEENAVNS